MDGVNVLMELGEPEDDNGFYTHEPSVGNNDNSQTQTDMPIESAHSTESMEEWTNLKQSLDQMIKTEEEGAQKDKEDIIQMESRIEALANTLKKVKSSASNTPNKSPSKSPSGTPNASNHPACSDDPEEENLEKAVKNLSKSLEDSLSLEATTKISNTSNYSSPASSKENDVAPQTAQVARAAPPEITSISTQKLDKLKHSGKKLKNIQVKNPFRRSANLSPGTPSWKGDKGMESPGATPGGNNASSLSTPSSPGRNFGFRRSPNVVGGSPNDPAGSPSIVRKRSPSYRTAAQNPVATQFIDEVATSPVVSKGTATTGDDKKGTESSKGAKSLKESKSSESLEESRQAHAARLRALSKSPPQSPKSPKSPQSPSTPPNSPPPAPPSPPPSPPLSPLASSLSSLPPSLPGLPGYGSLGSRDTFDSNKNDNDDDHDAIYLPGSLSDSLSEGRRAHSLQFNQQSQYSPCEQQTTLPPAENVLTPTQMSEHILSKHGQSDDPKNISASNQRANAATPIMGNRFSGDNLQPIPAPQSKPEDAHFIPTNAQKSVENAEENEKQQQHQHQQNDEQQQHRTRSKSSPLAFPIHSPLHKGLKNPKPSETSSGTSEPVREAATPSSTKSAGIATSSASIGKKLSFSFAPLPLHPQKSKGKKDAQLQQSNKQINNEKQTKQGHGRTFSLPAVGPMSHVGPPSHASHGGHSRNLSRSSNNHPMEHAHSTNSVGHAHSRNSVGHINVHNAGNGTAGSVSGGMVQPKTQQRLVLEEVAAQYFLNSENDRNPGTNERNGNNRYSLREYAVGMGLLYSSYGRGGYGGKNDNNDSDLAELVSFLDGISEENAEEETHVDFAEADTTSSPSQSQEPINNGVQNISNDVSVDTSQNDSNNIENETSIDRILEIASDHLSLGQNEMALKAYRRAMKCAFGDVLNVKRRLMNSKKSSGTAHSSTQQSQSTQKQVELQLEFTLLQVAARVADIHSNMGVVFEMNRQFDKAKEAYSDALDVYVNTCKRGSGNATEEEDPDVDRTKRNIERMNLACESSSHRKSLHAKANRIAQSANGDSKQRTVALQKAVAVLEEALRLEEETIGMSHPIAANTLVQMGKWRYEMKQYEESVSDLARAVDILTNALGPNHPQVGKTILLLASIYERQGHNLKLSKIIGNSKETHSPQSVQSQTDVEDIQLDLYVDALQPLKATLGDVHYDVGYLYIKIGYIYEKKAQRGKHGKGGSSGGGSEQVEHLNLAILAYKAALKAYGEPLQKLDLMAGEQREGIGKCDGNAKKKKGVHIEVVSLWVRITQTLVLLKSWKEVVISGRRALLFLRATKNSFVKESLGTNGLSIGTSNNGGHLVMSNISNSSGGAVIASNSSKSSNSIQSNHSHSSWSHRSHSSQSAFSFPLIQTSKISPIQIPSNTSNSSDSNDNYYQALFTVLSSLAQAHTSLGQYDLAEGACRESLSMAWEMALSSPNAINNSITPRMTNSSKISTLPAKNGNDRTGNNTSLNPNESLLQLIRTLKKLGKIYLLQTHYTQAATNYFLPALQLLRSTHDLEQTLDAASVLGSLGFLYLKVKRFVEAKNFLRECLRLYGLNGVDQNDRETRKVQAWLSMAESKEAESDSMPPSFLEIPTIIFHEGDGGPIDVDEI